MTGSRELMEGKLALLLCWQEYLLLSLKCIHVQTKLLRGRKSGDFCRQGTFEVNMFLLPRTFWGRITFYAVTFWYAFRLLMITVRGLLQQTDVTFNWTENYGHFWNIVLLLPCFCRWYLFPVVIGFSPIKRAFKRQKGALLCRGHFLRKMKSEKELFNEKRRVLL